MEERLWRESFSFYLCLACLVSLFIVPCPCLLLLFSSFFSLLWAFHNFFVCFVKDIKIAEEKEEVEEEEEEEEEEKKSNIAFIPSLIQVLLQ